MKRKIPLSQCWRGVLTILLFITSLNSFAQLSLYVGENEHGYLSTPEPPSGHVTHAWWKCDNPNVKFYDSGSHGTMVGITHYFEGTAYVECTYAYTYKIYSYGKEYTHVDHGTKTFRITCLPNYATISEDNIELKIGEAHRLSYTLGENSSIKGEWSSSNEDVATVDSKGNVRAVGSGKARIQLDPIVGPLVYCNVEVAKIDPTGIFIKEKNVFVVDGKSKTLSCELKPMGASSSLSWSSSDESVVKVSSTGKITGVSEGNATITVTTENGLSATYNVQVVSAPKSISLPNEKNVIKGYAVQLVPTLTPIGTETTYKWKSDNVSVVTVSSGGMVTGKNVGTATITATTDNGLTATCLVTVKEAPQGAESQDVKTNIRIVKDLIEETLKYIKQ